MASIQSPTGPAPARGLRAPGEATPSPAGRAQGAAQGVGLPSSAQPRLPEGLWGRGESAAHVRSLAAGLCFSQPALLGRSVGPAFGTVLL